MKSLTCGIPGGSAAESRKAASAGLEPARFDPETLAPSAARRNALQILVQSTCREIQRVDNAGRRLDADEGPLLRRPERHGSVVRAEADVEALRFAGDSDRRSALQVSQQIGEHIVEAVLPERRGLRSR